MIRLSAAAVLIAACIAPLKAGSQTLTGNGKSEGYLRFGVQYHDQQRATTDVALGGRFGFETAERWHMSAGAGFYTSQGFGHHDNQGYPFYDNDNHSYSILGDAYLKGKWGGSTLILGRQQIDTPFADSDDNGMVPNRFEAYTLLNSDIEGATIMFSHLVKWSGVDAPDPGRFTSLNPGHGVQMLGAIYEGMEDIALSCWYYHIEGMADLIYLESARQWHHGFGDLTLGLQYADEDYSE
ncbi:MAG TPA: outer membrane porin, OprD family, partial [Campylobacteraceae bacterium]|nr:outer membrane porin, OprD family [Campylobacteraceae bacterium]